MLLESRTLSVRGEPLTVSWKLIDEHEATQSKLVEMELSLDREKDAARHFHKLYKAAEAEMKDQRSQMVRRSHQLGAIEYS